MKPQDDAGLVDAFLDGELDLARQLAFEERLRDDASLRAQVEALRQLREALREGADYHAAPQALRERMAALVAAPGAPVAPTTPPAQTAQTAQTAPLAPSARSARSARARSASALLARWLAWRPLLGSFALVATLLVAVDVAWLRTDAEDRLREEVVASHVRSTLGQRLLDVASSDHHTVKPFLSARLDFSPPVSELSIPGSVFLGGRVDYLQGRPVAALVYRQGQHVVDDYTWPAPGPDSAPRFSALRGFQAAHWVQGGMTHWVVSDVNPEEFKVVVGALQRVGRS